MARAATVEVPSEFVEAKKHPRLRVVGHRLTSEEVDLLVAAHARGATSAALGVEFGVHRSTVVLHLRRRGVAPAPSPALSEAEIVEAARLYESGISINSVAQELDRSATTVRRRLLALGVHLR